MSRVGVLLLMLLTALTGLAFYYYPYQNAKQISLEVVASTPADVRILMLGNSLTHSNNLDQMVERIAESIDGLDKDVFVLRIAPGGYYMIDHRDDLFDAKKNSTLRQVLVSGTESMRKWDYVVFQEQSQMPGFDHVENQKTSETFQAATEIHQQASLTGATSVLMMTWGFWDGDSYQMNLHLYPDFLTMSQRLEQGYLHLARQFTASNDMTTIIAPAGLAFRAVYQEELARGVNPISEASLFRRLYVDDRHPSIAGSYLAASVIVASLFDVSVKGAGWVPGGLDQEEAARLRRIADKVVKEK